METAEIFALIKDSLRKSTNPLPVNDVWIGSHALETESVLVTYDRQFSAIPGLVFLQFPLPEDIPCDKTISFNGL